MKKSEKAFTLVETLIMVGVIGIIAIITIVSLRNMRPDKDYMMIRKAYSETAKAVATLANDDDLYPVQKTAYKPNKLNKYLTALINRQLAYKCDDMYYTAGYKECYGACASKVNGINLEGVDICKWPEGCGKYPGLYYFDYENLSSIDPLTCKANCKPCQEGYYQLTTGLCRCKKCASSCDGWGKNYKEPGISCTCNYCEKCPWGYGFKEIGSCECKKCPNEPPNCPEGYYNPINQNGCPSDKCYKQPSSSTSSSSSDSTIDCSANPNNPACSVGGGKGEDDPCISNPTSCIPNIEIPTENSANLDTGSPIGDDKTGDTNYTIPNFQEGSRGNVFSNTALPANAPSDMKTTNKFAYSFASLFDTKSKSCTNISCSFVTKDGMSWTVDDNFTKSSKDAIITVDINGKKGPNSRTTGNIDRFRFRVDAGGAINVYGQSTDADVQKAMKALTSRKFRKED